MICSIRISDDTYKDYVAHNPNSPQKAMEGQLERFRKVGPKERILILSEALLKRLEVIRGSSFEAPTDLVEWVEGSGKINAGEISLSLPPNTLELYKKRAAFYGKELPQALSEDFTMFLREKGVV